MTSPWLRSYDPGIPSTIDNFPDITLVDAVAKHAAERPEAVAAAFKGLYLTFRQLDEASDAIE
ncbi:MAG: hypothetical protein ACYC7A_20480 [Thermoanaerobaculia bacterium]